MTDAIGLRTTHDVVVIGAGPAGMAAATVASSLGLQTMLIDEQSAAGGQIYRNVASADPHVLALMGEDYAYGASLTSSLASSRVERATNTLVWDVSQDLTVTALQAGQARQWRGAQLIACTGAMERASPIPGWTLPGVMNAGAVQIAMKSGGVVPDGPVVLAGTGPLLLLVACQLLASGARVAALVETSSSGSFARAIRHLPAALRNWPVLAKGMKMLATLLRSRIPWYSGATDLAVVGIDRVEALTFVARGKKHRIEARYVLLHTGVVPNTQLSRLLRLEHRWDPAQFAWHVVTDDFGETSLKGLRMAGDGTAIAGARAAELSGALAALGAAHSLGRLSSDEFRKRSQRLRQALKAETAVRPLLDAIYAPPKWIREPADETIVCRCEEVSAGRVREMARLGCVGPNQTKFFSRCGMGPCQGRICGSVVTQLLAAELRRSPDEVGAYRIRAPIKPVPLGALAAMQDADLSKTRATLHEESTPEGVK